MKWFKLGCALVGILALGLVGWLGFRAYKRHLSLQAMHSNFAGLQAENQRLKLASARDQVAAAAPKPSPDTGFFQAERAPATGFRRMTWGEDKAGHPRVAYVAPLPDLVPGDFVGFTRTDKALMATLNAEAQARVMSIAAARGTGGGRVDEALVVDGQLIYVIERFGRWTKNIPITAIQYADKPFAKQLVQEVSDAAADR